MRVQVLNGSGIAGAAGRLTERLEGEGWDMLPAGNAPQRYGASAVYYSHDVLKDQAAEIAVDTGVGGVVVLAMPSPAPFAVEGADVYVVVLIGADDLGGSLRPPARSSSLRPRPRNDVALPLPDDVPRDRYVPGLADIQIFSQVNDQSESGEVLGAMNALSGWLNAAGRYSPLASGQIFAAREKCDWPPKMVAGELQTADDPRFCTLMDREYLEEQVWPNIERSLAYFGFTAQNVCGAPAGYSFTDLLQPTREISEETDYYTGQAIFTTDRLLELYGGQRINPEDNPEFYIREAVQTAHDLLRLPELLDETEAPQLVLCRAWLAPAGEVPEFANGAYYALLTPGIQPRENLLSQGTYHVKEISRNGNFAYVVVCHPTIGNRFVLLWWREAGYRAEIVEDIRTGSCQAAFEEFAAEPESIEFTFGERVFSSGDLRSFPRAGRTR